MLLDIFAYGFLGLLGLSLFVALVIAIIRKPDVFLVIGVLLLLLGVLGGGIYLLMESLIHLSQQFLLKNPPPISGVTYASIAYIGVILAALIARFVYWLRKDLKQNLKTIGMVLLSMFLVSLLFASLVILSS